MVEVPIYVITMMAGYIMMDLFLKVVRLVKESRGRHGP